MPKPKKIPAYLTAEEIRRLFAVISSPRDRAIFRVNYHRGLRASEVGMIQVGDYHAGRLLIKRLKGSNGGEYELVNRARNLRLSKASEVPVARELSRPHEETAAEAIRRIDALCPWLVGAERCVSRRQGG